MGRRHAGPEVLVMTKLLAALAILAAVIPIRAETALAPAFAEARRATLRATAAFVPSMCSVESWCLVKATECFLGQTTQPTGLWKAFTQYSVVRRVRALCPTGAYGAWESRIFMGSVEPQVFSSAIETSEETAVASALKLCRVYRADWVSAAPACAGN